MNEDLEIAFGESVTFRMNPDFATITPHLIFRVKRYIWIIEQWHIQRHQQDIELPNKHQLTQVPLSD